jgi:hypothetical protein
MAWTGGGVHGWEVQGVGMAEFTEMLVCVNLVPQLFSVAQTEAAFRHVNRLALVAASEVRPQPATRNPQPATRKLEPDMCFLFSRIRAFVSCSGADGCRGGGELPAGASRCWRQGGTGAQCA